MQRLLVCVVAGALLSLLAVVPALGQGAVAEISGTVLDATRAVLPGVVTGEAPLVEVTKSDVGTNITGQNIEALPTAGRQQYALLQLVPGLTPTLATGSFEGAQYSSGGQSISNRNASNFGQSIVADTARSMQIGVRYTF